jgi:hypothetical protein
MLGDASDVDSSCSVFGAQNAARLGCSTRRLR